MTDDLGITRESILSGTVSLERRVANLLQQIEERCLYLLSESRRVVEAYFLSDQPPNLPEDRQDFYRRFDEDRLLGFKLKVRSIHPLQLADLERLALHWQVLLPEQPALLAHLIRLLDERYKIHSYAVPNLQTALGFSQPEIQTAYQELTGSVLDNSFGEGPQLPAPSPAPLPPAEAAIEDAVRGLDWLLLKDGQTLYQAGDPSDALYVVISGRLRVLAPQENGKDRLIDEISRGEMIGAIEIFTSEERTVTVQAIRDSELVRLGQTELFQLAEKHHHILYRLNRLMANRLKAQISGLSLVCNQLTTLAILPAGEGSSSRRQVLKAFAQHLADLLSRFGPVYHLDRQRLEAELGPGAAQVEAVGPANSRLTSWLSQQEAQYRFILYEADPAPSEWTRTCLRQADRILLVAEAAQNPRLGAAEKAMKRIEPTAQVELVLLHAPGTHRPSGTARWLSIRNVQTHHHVRLDVEEDYRRLSRRLTGNALGLVLGGGGARGFAHVGVQQALLEAGLGIDLIGGTSMGAVLGAAFAMDMTHANVMRIIRKVASPFKVFDPTLPLVSFFSSDKVTRVFQDIYDDIQIEDLWRPFFCVSSNLTRAIPMIHRSGPLWAAVRASSAIPGIFSPLLYNGELLVDGAVLNNLPLDVMQTFSQGGPIVAVNVFPEVDLDKDYDFGPSVSGWSTLLNWVNPLKHGEQAPNIFENLVRVIALNDVHQAKAKRGLADLHIRPPVERFGILDFSAYKQIIALGYQDATQEIAAWRQTPAGARLTQSMLRPIDRVNQALDELIQTLEGKSELFPSVSEIIEPSGG